MRKINNILNLFKLGLNHPFPLFVFRSNNEIDLLDPIMIIAFESPSIQFFMIPNIYSPKAF